MWHTSLEWGGCGFTVSQHGVFLLCFFADAAAALGMPRNRGEWVSWPLGGVAVCGSVLSVCLSVFQVPSGPLLELDEDLR